MVLGLFYCQTIEEKLQLALLLAPGYLLPFLKLYCGIMLRNSVILI